MAVTIRNSQSPALTMRDAMDRLMEAAFTNPWRPAFWSDTAANGAHSFRVDIYENSEAYIVTAVLPGVNPDALEITTLNGTLTISCEVKPTVPQGFELLYREMVYGLFRRDIRLPGDFAYDQAEAVFEGGVLTLTLPKAEHLKPKSLKVKVAK